MRLSLLIFDYSSISYGNRLFLLDNLAYSNRRITNFSRLSPGLDDGELKVVYPPAGYPIPERMK
jgi:hypothetical protein